MYKDLYVPSKVFVQGIIRDQKYASNRYLGLQIQAFLPKGSDPHNSSVESEPDIKGPQVPFIARSQFVGNGCLQW